MLRSSPYKEVLEGREFTGLDELPTLRAVYQLGDFRYQVRSKSGWKSPIKVCRRPDTVDYLEQQLRTGNTVVVEVPRRSPP